MVKCYDLNEFDLSKRCESINTMASFLWWIVGFYWVVSGGDMLQQNAPLLYWVCVVFLAFDVFFAIFCVVLACLIGVALCCCLPCIIAILYAVARQEGASEADLSILPRYKFRVSGEEKSSVGAGKLIPMATEINCEKLLKLNYRDQLILFLSVGVPLRVCGSCSCMRSSMLIHL